MGQLWRMDDMNTTRYWDQDPHLCSNLVKGLRMDSGAVALTHKNSAVFTNHKSMWWCWANRMMVLGKKWWKTNPIAVFAYQTRSFLRMKIACSHNNGDMIPMNQHLRRRILAPEIRTPLASNLCATSPCEKCGERCPRQWEWKIMENP